MMSAEHADHIQPVLNFVLPTEAVVHGRVGQEPATAAVIQADAAASATTEAQRGVLGDAESGGQVMQQHQRVPVAGA